MSGPVKPEGSAPCARPRSSSPRRSAPTTRSPRPPAHRDRAQQPRTPEARAGAVGPGAGAPGVELEPRARVAAGAVGRGRRRRCETRRRFVVQLRMAGWAMAMAALAAAPMGAESLALVGGRLIDGYGGAPLEDSVVVIEGERIAAVGSVGRGRHPGGCDGDLHRGDERAARPVGHARPPDDRRPRRLRPLGPHLPDRCSAEIMPAAAAQLLLAGVTSARDLGAPLETILAVRDAHQPGEIAGPDALRLGAVPPARALPRDRGLPLGHHGPEDARAKVDRLAARRGRLRQADRPGPDDAWRRCTRSSTEAHRHGLPVLAHAHRVEEIRRGIAAGVDGFEHTGLGTAPEYPEDVVTLLRERARPCTGLPPSRRCCSTSTPATTPSASTTRAGRSGCRRTWWRT
jgi:hypothetical protein